MLEDCQVALVKDFRGPWSSVDVYTVPITNGLSAQNVEYDYGQVETRLGTSTILTANNTITSFTNWLFNVFGVPKNWFFYYASGVGIRSYDLDSIGSGPQTWIAQISAYAAAYAVAGSRIYIAFYVAGPAGDTAAQVFSYTGSNDVLFAGPIATSMTLTEPGAGVVTAGIHKIGYLITTRNGFTTRPSPAPSNSFTAGSITSSGSKNINININPAAWPSYAASVQVIMTTVANPNQYYIVPGSTTGVPAGLPLSINMIVSISDIDLAATGTDATPYFNLLVTNLAGTPPFIPYNIFNYSSRMGYITLDPSGVPVCYFSDLDKYQQLTADLNGIYLPGNLMMTCGASLRGVAYLFGPHWTYAVSDDGNSPAQWAKPQQVDGSIGTLSPRGVYANAAQGFLWVADVSGLYLFIGGKYPSLPISFWNQADWKRINWTYAHMVQVYDDVERKVVHVLAPLDSATTPSHELTWDYSQGTDPDSVNFAYYVRSGYSHGSGGIIQNPTTRQLEVWYGPSSNGNVIRQNISTDSNPYRDVAAAIDSYYETALLPGPATTSASLKLHHGGHIRISGAGTLELKVYATDHVKTVTPPTITLAASPGIEILRKWFLMNEQCSVRFRTNAADEHFRLALYRHYYTYGPAQR